MFLGICFVKYVFGELIYLFNESLLFYMFIYLLNFFIGKIMYLYYFFFNKFMVFFVIVVYLIGISFIVVWSLGKE